MIRTVYQAAEPRFVWYDVVDPSQEELERIAGQHGLPETAVRDCLDPEHLPKFERFDGHSFVILRSYDEESDSRADTIRELTRKVAIFFGDGFLLTIHRKPQRYLENLFQQWQRPQPCPAGATHLACALVDVANAAVLSFEPMLERSEQEIDTSQERLLSDRRLYRLLGTMYLLKRRVSLAKRMLWHAFQVSARLQPPQERMNPLFQDLRENAESMHFWADELMDEVNNLLQMQLSLASHRTNEVMRVLTVFSAFFLPLTFIVGIYGMNFRYMPELTRNWGYPAVWALMLGVSFVIYRWFRQRGWL